MSDRSEAQATQQRTITERECLETGGHCWQSNGYENLYYDGPPRKPTRTCHHCAKRQVGVFQEPVRWEDSDG